jgi:hypothetical protein
MPPVGSHSQHVPRVARLVQVISARSVLVEVATTGPGWRFRLGATTRVVLPERGGPMIRAWCCGPPQTGPERPVPRYRPAHALRPGVGGEVVRAGLTVLRALAMSRSIRLVGLLGVGLVVIGFFLGQAHGRCRGCGCG